MYYENLIGKRNTVIFLLTEHARYFYPTILKLQNGRKLNRLSTKQLIARLKRCDKARDELMVQRGRSLWSHDKKMAETEKNLQKLVMRKTTRVKQAVL